MNQLTEDDLENYEDETNGKAEKENINHTQENLNEMNSENAITPEFVEKEGKLWKNYMMENPDVIDYGTKEIEITDYCIIDENGYISNNIEKGSEYTVKFKVHFNEKVDEPILALTIKDIKGTEVTGTNTMYEKVNFESEEGTDRIVSFTQRMNLSRGNYLISFGCTGYRNGVFTVYHRMYDVMNLMVISDKENVGFYDMFSKVIVE